MCGLIQSIQPRIRQRTERAQPSPWHIISSVDGFFGFQFCKWSKVNVRRLHNLLFARADGLVPEFSVETIISYKKLSHLFLSSGIIYGKIQQFVELSARNWPLKANVRGGGSVSSMSWKVGRVGRWDFGGARVHIWILTDSWGKLEEKHLQEEMWVFKFSDKMQHEGLEL